MASDSSNGVRSLQVLNERDLDHLVVVDLTDDDRDVPQTDLHRGLVPPLAGHDLKTMSTLSDDDRLDDALFRNRRHQLRQVAHDLPRLVRVRVDQVHRHHAPDRRARGT
jgi:hypothetical protein